MLWPISTMGYKGLTWSCARFSFISSFITLPLAHSLPATLGSLLFFKHSKRTSTSGHLHFAISLTRTVFHQLPTWLIPSLYSGLFSKITSSERLFLIPLSKQPLCHTLSLYHALSLQCIILVILVIYSYSYLLFVSLITV